MTWTAADILAGGAQVPDDEQMRLCREAMADPERISVTVKGRNGQTVKWGIQAHDRGHLSLTQGCEQDDPYADIGPFRYPHEIHPPAWKRWTWTIEQRFNYRPEDFLFESRAARQL